MSDILKTISDLATDLRGTQRRIEELEAELAKFKTREKHIAENLLPTEMQQLGVEEITAGGLKITLADKYIVDISDKNSEAAFSWLDANGHGGMIKREVAVKFGKQSEEAATALKAELEERYSEVRHKSDIHKGTLKKWVREMLEDGKEIPESITYEKTVVAKAKLK